MKRRLLVLMLLGSFLFTTTAFAEVSEAQKAYYDDLADKIQSKWDVPKIEHQYLVTEIKFSLDEAGNITKTDLFQKSGQFLLDSSAMTALIAAVPFPKLPEGLKQEPYSALFSITKNGDAKVGVSNNVIGPNMSDYIRNLQKRIKQNWNRGQSAWGTTRLLFKIARDGTLLKVEINKSCGSKEADNAALDAVLKAAPFPPLPEDFKNDSVDILFSFNVSSDAKQVQKWLDTLPK